MIELLTQYWPALLKGIASTLIVTVVACGAGTVLGAFVAWYRYTRNNPATLFLAGILCVVSAIPVLVLLMWAHFPLQAALGVIIPPLLTLTVVLTIVCASLVSSVLHSSLRNFPQELSESALSLGLSRAQIVRRIVLPIVMRRSLSALIMIQITTFHMTIFGSLISANEILRTVLRINATEFQPIELYTLLAFFFLVTTTPMLLLAHRYKADDLLISRNV